MDRNRKSSNVKNARGSVSRVLSSSAILSDRNDVRPFLYAAHCCDALATNPEDWQEDAMCLPYSVLLPVGFAVPPMLPPARCALTAPFRPYHGPIKYGAWRYNFCGTFPGVAPAGSYPAPFLAGARTFLPHAVTRMAAVARPSGKWLYSSAAFIVQQQTKQYCAAFAVDDAINIFWTKAALESDNGRRPIFDAITIAR